MAGSDTNKEADALEDAREAFNRASEAEAHNRLDALEDLKFGRLGEQWPETIRKQRELDGRPCLTINRIPAFVRQVVNDARQNKPAITVHPVDSGSDPETAEIITGLIRHVEQSSDAEVAYDTALESAVSGGFGYFGINTRYATDDGFEQDIVIEVKPDPLAIYGDPDSTAADSADWNSAFEKWTLTKEAFERRWKGMDPVGFDGQSSKPVLAKSGEIVEVATRWVREETTRQIVAVSPPTDPDAAEAAGVMQMVGDRLILDLKVYEANKAAFQALGMNVIGSPRTVPSHKVRQCIYSGADELESNDWAGKYIPLVPVYGEMLNIEGKRYFRSMYHDAKDAQRMFNYWRTSATELVALAPKAPFIGKVGQFDTDGAKWANANTQTYAYLEYDDVDGAGAPQRQPFAGIPAGAIQEALNASDDMKSIMGMFDASLGAKSNETSGKAIMARQREGDVGSFHFIDNLSRAIRHGGRIILDLIPKVYSTERELRILGPDGDARTVGINGHVPAPKPIAGNTPQQPGAPEEMSPMQDQAADIARTFDLTVGKYDVVVSAGPSFTSRREEAATQMLQLIQAYPAVAPVIGDLLAKNLDWPGADEIAKRLQAMLPAQLHGEDAASQAAHAQMQKMAQIIGQLKGELASANADKSNESRKIDIDAYEAETGRLTAVAPLIAAAGDPNQIAMLVSQSMAHLLNSPDILEAHAAGAPTEQIAQMLASRMRGGQPQDPQQGGAPPTMQAA